MAFTTGKRTLRTLLEHRATTTPGDTFVIFDDLSEGVTNLTYREFDVTTNQIAHYLLGLGLEPGERINLHLGNCLEFLYLWFGAAKCGIVIMPTNTALSRTMPRCSP